HMNIMVILAVMPREKKTRKKEAFCSFVSLAFTLAAESVYTVTVTDTVDTFPETGTSFFSLPHGLKTQ
ncbi:hypothetical protein STEG23_017095, partial [Scotinomys teguina]